MVSALVITGCAPRQEIKHAIGEQQHPSVHAAYRWQSDVVIMQGPWPTPRAVRVQPEYGIPWIDTCTTISKRISDNHKILTDRDGLVGIYPPEYGLTIVGSGE